jgi:hypothetical protein
MERIKANELRIGNYIHILTSIGKTKIPLPTGRYGLINNIRQDKVQILYNYETDPKSSCLFNRAYESISPIPLTEEWLLKFGFRINTVDGLPWYEKECLTLDYMFDFERHDASTNRVHYVHQLQNLYFALTGEELTIKYNGQSK